MLTRRGESGTREGEVMRMGDRRRYIARKAAGLCIRCGFEPTTDGKVECDGCGEQTNERNKEYYAKRAKKADGTRCSTCLRNKPTPGRKSCASCVILRAAKYRKQKEKA